VRQCFYQYHRLVYTVGKAKPLLGPTKAVSCPYHLPLVAAHCLLANERSWYRRSLPSRTYPLPNTNGFCQISLQSRRMTHTLLGIMACKEPIVIASMPILPKFLRGGIVEAFSSLMFELCSHSASKYSGFILNITPKVSTKSGTCQHSFK